MAPSRNDVRSLDCPDRQWVAWQQDGVFTKNPDVVMLLSGKLLCTFNACDCHWPREFSKISVIESTDRGLTWGRPRVVSAAYPGRGDERWVTPRISLLSDGRLAIVCDQNDYRHCHETQPPGIYAWWSHDQGDTWEGPTPTGIPGIEPDRVRELPDGTLLVGSQFMRPSTQKLAQAVSRSTDGGKTWGDLAIVASDPVHNHCEGAFVQLQSGRLACIMRENNHGGYPSYVSMSDDRGRTWSSIAEAPFAGDRPFAAQLPDGRTLVTFRNQTGRPGLCAWLGDIESERGYKVARGGAGRPHSAVHDDSSAQGDVVDARGLGVGLEDGQLVLQNGPDTVTRYVLMPPESFTSQVRFECEVQVEGPDRVPAASIVIARVGVSLVIQPDGVRLSTGVSQGSDRRAVDMRQPRRVEIEHQGGLVDVRVDGQIVLSKLVYDASGLGGFFGNGPDHRGHSAWRSVSYEIRNPAEASHAWQWDARSGDYPNQYAIDRWLELDYNSNPRPDHGYSSWVQFDDGEILVLDYTNEDSPAGKALLKGYRLRAQDFDA